MNLGFPPCSLKRILIQAEIVVGLWYYPSIPDIHLFHFIRPDVLFIPSLTRHVQFIAIARPSLSKDHLPVCLLV